MVKVLTQRELDLILSQAKSLRATPFAVSEQFPSAVREKRAAQVPILTDLRKTAKENHLDDSIRLFSNKLIVNSKVSTEKNLSGLYNICWAPSKC